MDALTLPLAPGSATAVLHPINVFGASWVILRHALRSLNPDTAIVRRTHHAHRARSHAGAAESRGADTASLVSSRGSQQSNTSSAVVAGGAAGSVASDSHRRHRTHSGEHGSKRRHHRTSSSQEGETAAGDTTAETTAEAAPSSGRRARSAEEPLAAARRSAAKGDNKTTEEERGHRVRRSHSDGMRGRSSRRGSEGGSGSGTTTPRLSASRRLSPAATAAAASGLTPPLAPPTPVSRGLGKPPLSSRQHLSTTATSTGAKGDEAALPASSSSAARHSHHRGDSGGGLSSSGRSSRTRRSAAENDESNEGSVIVIRDGTGINIGSVFAGWPSFLFPSAEEGSDGSFSWSPRVWWNRIRKAKVNRAAFLINHVLHTVPVMAVHYCCELKRQLVTLPLLRFLDVFVKFTSQTPTPSGAEGQVRHAGTPAATSTHHNTKIVTEWPPTEDAFVTSSPATIGHLLLTRWMFQNVESYIEMFFFLDESLVVRQLRSKRTPQRVIGWTLRVVSHTIFDPLLLSIILPMLICSSESSAERTEVPRVLFTVPGLMRGLGTSAVSVVIQWLVMPTASRLVYRAVLTMFELVEYLIMRRYAHWSDEEADEDDDMEGEYDDANDGASLASGVSGASHGLESRSVSQQSSGSAATAAAEDRILREQRRLRREKRERRKRREQRQAAREQAMRHTILRAIVYRVVSSVVAHVAVDHPLSVLAELLRGRATLHFTGMLTPYASMTAAQDGLIWANVWRYAKMFAAPVENAATGKQDDGVPRMVVALRRAGRNAAHELLVISSSVLSNSGQQEAVVAVQRRAAEKRAKGEVTSAADSADFLVHSALSLSPFYYGLQFTVIDKVLSFYIAVWTRLTKQ